LKLFYIPEAGDTVEDLSTKRRMVVEWYRKDSNQIKCVYIDDNQKLTYKILGLDEIKFIYKCGQGENV
jgi:hypothetical protein